jgi:hypothetical protein
MDDSAEYLGYLEYLEHLGHPAHLDDRSTMKLRCAWLMVLLRQLLDWLLRLTKDKVKVNEDNKANDATKNYRRIARKLDG